VHPEWYSDEFGRLLRRAGRRRITVHDSRHTTLTLMEHAGVPISIVSKSGHYDSAFTQKTYSGTGLRWPRSTRSLRPVRNCEKTSLTRAAKRLDH